MVTRRPDQPCSGYEGALSSLDFQRARGTATDWFGMSTNAVLAAYSLTGVLGLARRDGNRRYYDLIERLLPADVLAPAGGETPLGLDAGRLLDEVPARQLLGGGSQRRRSRRRS